MSVQPFESLTMSSNPVIAVLAGLVITLFGVIVVQWRYTTLKTVPKWVWDELISEIKQLIKNQTEIIRGIDKISK